QFIDHVRTQDNRKPFIGQAVPIELADGILTRVKSIFHRAAGHEFEWRRVMVTKLDPQPSRNPDQSWKPESAADLEHLKSGWFIGLIRPWLACYPLGQKNRARPEISPVRHVVGLLIPGDHLRVVEQHVRVQRSSKPDRGSSDIERCNLHRPLIYDSIQRPLPLAVKSCVHPIAL